MDISNRRVKAVLAAAAAGLLLGMGACPTPNVEGDQSPLIEESVEIAFGTVRAAQLVAKNAQVWENLVEPFPASTAGYVRSELRWLNRHTRELPHDSSRIRNSLMTAQIELVRALDGMVAMNRAIAWFNKAADLKTTSAAQTSVKEFDRVIGVPGRVERHLKKSVSSVLQATDGIRLSTDDDTKVLTGLRRLERRVRSTKELAIALGRDRRSLLIAARETMQDLTQSSPSLSTRARLPDEACGSIPSAEFMVTGVDIIVFTDGPTCKSAMDIARAAYRTDSFRATGEWFTAKTACKTHGAFENQITECDTPWGRVTFTGPGSA